MTLDEMKRAYAAQGGAVTRVPQGKRSVPRSVVRNLTRDDTRRGMALAALAALAALEREARYAR